MDELGLEYRYLAKYLQEKITVLTKIPADNLEPLMTLEHYGMDSIMMLHFFNQIIKDFPACSGTFAPKELQNKKAKQERLYNKFLLLTERVVV